MDLHFVDPSEAPVPPDEVRIREIKVQPTRGGSILNVQIHLTPFHERPSLEVELVDSDDRMLAHTSIIEVVNPSMEFNLHVRGKNGTGQHRLRVEVGYPESDPVDVREVDIELNREA